MKSFLLLSAFVGYTVAECPNSCSGHGTCKDYDQCVCQDEGVVINPMGNIYKSQAEIGIGASKEPAWTGADCSLMRCPRGVSWTVAASDDTTDDAEQRLSKDPAGALCEHQLSVECSDKGMCNRVTGQCSCFPGYTGAACQRTACPNDCSGHGICQSNVKFAQDATIMMDPSLYAEYGFNADFDYLVSYDKAWDSGLHFGCRCDIGYRGPDCSLVECPSNDDPLDDFCTGGRTGLGYIEFVGSEYYFSAQTGSLDPQEAPLPNKLLMFVESYESTDVTMRNNGCQITADGNYVITDQQKLSSALKDSTSHQNDQDAEGTNRARSGVVDAGAPGNGAAQANAQGTQVGLDVDGNPIISPGNLQGHVLSMAPATTDLISGEVTAAAVMTISDCVNGVFCGGAKFGEPCSGRGLCNYADGTCDCHSGYAGNACSDVEELN